MSSQNKTELRTTNSDNFPNNNSQFITPEKLREFNNDIIDSMVVNDDTGSYLLTSSFDTGSRDLTFTKVDGSTYTNSIPGGSGGSADTGSLLVTASISDATITFTKGDAETFDITVDNVVSSSYAVSSSRADSALTADTATSATSASHAEHSDTTQEVIINVKNKSGGTLAIGTPVYATGVTGDNINVSAADYSSASTMPAIAVLQEELTNNASGEATVSGKIIGVNTSGFTAGRNIYVASSGTFTDTKPTGSNLIQNIGVVGKVNATEGEIIIQGSGRSNDVPNITEGYGWFGNSDGVAEAQTTSSFAKTDLNNTFTGTQNFDNISVSGTGSFGYIESVTGSAKIIGDAYIILNNDTPAQRYAGLVVQDSGSGSPLTTASLEFDGESNDWFYEYSDDGGSTVDHGVVMFGPEYNTKGSPTYLTNNRVPVGDGSSGHLNDSKLEVNGTNLSIPPQADASQFVNITANTDSDLGQVYASIKIEDRGTGYNDAYFEINAYTGIDGTEPVVRLRGGGSSAGGQDNSLVAMTDSGDAFFYKDSTWVDGTTINISGSANLAPSITTNIAATDRTNTFTEKQITSGSEGYVNQRVEAPGSSARHDFITVTDGTENNGEVYGYTNHSLSNYSGRNYSDTFLTEIYDSEGYNYGTEMGINGGQFAVSQISSGSVGQQAALRIRDNYEAGGDLDFQGTNIGIGTWGGNYANTQVAIGSANSQVYYSGTANFYGEVNLNGSVLTAVNTLSITSDTASVDFSDSGMNVLTLPSGSNTHIVATNVGEGQTVNLLIRQGTDGGTGSIDFSSDFFQPTGSEYVPTPEQAAKDVLTFMTYDNINEIFTANVTKFVSN